MSGLLQGFDVALAGTNLAMCIIGVLLGTVIGVLPGLGARQRSRCWCR